MKNLLRIGLLVVATVAVFAGIGLGHIDSIAQLGSEFLDGHNLGWRTRDESQLSQRLEKECGSITSCNLEKMAVVDELLSNEISLAQAAARFQLLDSRLPSRDEARFRAVYLGNTQEERYCRQVIAFVASRHGGSPAKLEMALADLMSELDPPVLSTNCLLEQDN
jgi:hypothetical protein